MAVEEDEVVVEENLDTTVEEEALETEEDQGQESESEIDPDEEDVVVTLGEDPEEEQHEEAPGWVKKVRKSNRRLESENKKLKRELQQRSTEGRPKVTLGEKPTLKSAKYDDKAYEKQLAEYFDRKRVIEAQETESKKAAKVQTDEWEKRQGRYAAQQSEHDFSDFAEVEELVTNTLSNTQQTIIVQGAEDSALLVYALGKNPKKLEELAGVKNPVDFAVRIGKLESQLKVTKRKAPAPEKRVTGGKTGGLGGSDDATLTRLREKAAKTGDYTEVTAYKRSKRSQ